ncbi:mannose-6-phosphate isomerase [Spiroplasma clarkii]|uniref:Mannose-6-phosphate isomerase n=1 Tax=Spiroplasma clarkii TaxID=2139 RepID=A0A1Y0L2M4_9MOLU|nr:type I phosphomannose isomerase catalytic subunit [Spiroplasma clarkii]ARU92271.1 mannose-6-phosphate isomerase [Spiroplasma clarkii]ATX71584.1 mannose-6-phosphate isomerase [Spiroplasma clarkii]
MNSIFKIKPYFSERIWGGSKLRDFGFAIPNEKIGEAWVISAHENGMGYVDYLGKTISLKEFYQNKALFADSRAEYPLLVKIITANDYLSVQVHPDDEYALKHHNSLGKPESWYILDCPVGAKLIYGHNAKTKAEMTTAIEQGAWKEVLKEVDIAPGDFLYVEPGKIHAITPGVTVYELQRSSDITYRLYDYDHLDDLKKPRELHIEDSLKNIKIPDSADVIVRQAQGAIFDSPYFSLFLYQPGQNFAVNPEIPWYQLTVIAGSGTINGVDFKMGESAIYLNQNQKLAITGNLKVIISWIK